MLDIKFIRQNPEVVKQAAKAKNVSVDVDKLLALDERRRQLQGEVDQTNSFRNAIAKASEGGKPTPDQIAQGKKYKEQAAELERELKAVETELNELLLMVPQIPDESVPVGTTDADNKEVRTWGEVPSFDFEPKDYMTLMESLDLADVERGAKVSGFRGYFLKNEAALLSQALWMFALSQLIKKGFTPIIAPAIANEMAFRGTGWLPQGKDEVYKVGDDAYLIGTSEVSMMAYHSGEILLEKDLPKKYVAFSPCFRSEAGSYGKDTKGILRVHEFYKIEQVILGKADHEDSVAWHEEITKNSEELVQALNLPYRVVVNCMGDLGLGQVKKYDIETWLPSQQRYRETHSASYFHDFQTRRLNIKYRDNKGQTHFAYSLNNTAIATPRILAAIVENYQTNTGTVKIPEVLKPWMLGKEEISR